MYEFHPHKHKHTLGQAQATLPHCGRQAADLPQSSAARQLPKGAVIERIYNIVQKKNPTGITPLQNDPQQLRFWAMRNFPIYPFERISIGMLRQYPPWPKNKACERFSATE